MTNHDLQRLILLAGGVQAAIVVANLPLPRRLKVRENLAGVPCFLRQIFYVHWMYIVLVVGLFSALCFLFPRELAGASLLGRFLGAFMAGFWLLRLGLQWFYYDREIRRQNRVLDALYVIGLVILIGIFGWATMRSVG
jgi:hypothetical protein